MANPLYIHSTKLLHVLPFLGGREVKGNDKKKLVTFPILFLFNKKKLFKKI
jgi:hypothetical protein